MLHRRPPSKEIQMSRMLARMALGALAVLTAIALYSEAHRAPDQP
jgi:hypothetical protein